MTVRIEGLDKLRLNLDRVLGAALDGAARGMNQWSESVMTESKENRVPVDENVLRSTGVVMPPEIQSSTVTQEMGYGGPAAPYALKQHEDLGLNHPDGKSAKYLEGPALENAGRLQSEVSKEVEREIKGAIK